MDQVAVSAVDIQYFKTGLVAAPGGITVGLDDTGDLREGDSARSRPTGIGGQGRRTNCLPKCLPTFCQVSLVQRQKAVPGPLHRGLAPGMQNLSAGHRAHIAHCLGQFGQRTNEIVVPNAQIAIGQPGLRGDAQGFGEDQAGTA